MKITILLPEIKDEKVKNCLEELIRQVNASIDDMQKQIAEIRSEKDGKH